MTREELRKQFQKETNTFPIVGARQPYSKHIECLEDKLIEQYIKQEIKRKPAR